MASIIIEANGICHRKSKQGKNEGSNVFNDYEAGSRGNNVVLSGKDVCKRSIAFSWNVWERNKQKFWVAGSRNEVGKKLEDLSVKRLWFSTILICDCGCPKKMSEKDYFCHANTQNHVVIFYWIKDNSICQLGKKL